VVVSEKGRHDVGCRKDVSGPVRNGFEAFVDVAKRPLPPTLSRQQDRIVGRQVQPAQIEATRVVTAGSAGSGVPQAISRGGPSGVAVVQRDVAALQPYWPALSDLRDFGTSPHDIAAHMNEDLAQRELFSVVPDDDARIKRIFDAAEIAPKFALHITDAEELIAELARLQGLTPATIACARREAEVMCLTGIRAEARVRFLATYWGLVAWHH
jgi:hypothetical protein